MARKNSFETLTGYKKCDTVHFTYSGGTVQHVSHDSVGKMRRCSFYSGGTVQHVTHDSVIHTSTRKWLSANSGETVK